MHLPIRRQSPHRRSLLEPTSRTEAERAALQAALYRMKATYYVKINGLWWPLTKKVFRRGGRYEPIALWHIPVGGAPTVGWNEKSLRRKISEGTIRRGREVLR